MKILPAGTVKRIHVDRRVVAQNRKYGTDKPALTIQTSKGPLKAHFVHCEGPVEFLQADGVEIKPLACGARLWAFTTQKVEYR